MNVSLDRELIEYKSCHLCPRNCGINRYEAMGYCHEKADLHVSRAALHMWEEPCISGSSGSGTVFFSGCNMGCVFCQNKAISKGEVGKIISIDRLVDIFFELEDKGANNINLVTGDMFIPTIRTAIEIARSKGLTLPFLFNTSSYLNLDAVKSLDGLIDIYLPDLKYIREKDAIKYSNAHGYVQAARAAIDEMVRQQPACLFIEKECPEKAAIDNNTDKQTIRAHTEKILQKGVVVRHLLMPGMLIQAKLIVKYLYDRYGDNIFISLMNQYTPSGDLEGFAEINRKVAQAEYDSLIDYAAQIGVVNGFMQIGETAKESFIPQFDLTGV
jgi:putative pyruvate formate lyase activating enzyme